MVAAGIIHHVNTSHKVIAITFDDGPNPLYTPKVLEIFRGVSGKATFFMIGQKMIEHPEIVKAVSNEFHEIGNHTYSHIKLTQLSTTDCLNEMRRTDQIIKDLTGMKPTAFRPPYFDYNDKIVSLTERLGYKIIGALNTDALDWEQPGVDYILSKTRQHIKNGSILIFHDGYGDRSQTIEAVRKLVIELKTEGYRLITVSELLSLADR